MLFYYSNERKVYIAFCAVEKENESEFPDTHSDAHTQQRRYPRWIQIETEEKHFPGVEPAYHHRVRRRRRRTLYMCVDTEHACIYNIYRFYQRILIQQ